MQYTGKSEEIQALKEAVTEAVKASVREAVGYTLGHEITSVSLFPLYTTKSVGRLFGVSQFTVRAWVRQGLLHPRLHRISGRSVRFLFTNSDLLKFLDENFPSKADLGHPCDPRSRKGALVEQLLRMTNLYKRRRQRVEEDEEG